MSGPIDLATLQVNVTADDAVASTNKLTGSFDKATASSVNLEAQLKKQDQILRQIAERGGGGDAVTGNLIRQNGGFERFAQIQQQIQQEMLRSDAIAAQQAVSLSNVGNAASTGGLGLGRIRQGLISLIAQETGTIPVVDRIAGSLGTFAVGGDYIIGIVAGIAAIGYAWKKITEDAHAAQAALEDYHKTDQSFQARSVSASRVQAAVGTGPGASTFDVPGMTAQVDKLQKAASALRDELSEKAGFVGGLNPVNQQIVALRTAYERGTLSAQQFNAEVLALARAHPDYGYTISQVAQMAGEYEALKKQIAEATATIQQHLAATESLKATYGTLAPDAVKGLVESQQRLLAFQQGGAPGLRIKSQDLNAVNAATDLWKEYVVTVDGAKFAQDAFSDALAGKDGKGAQDAASKLLTIAQDSLRTQDAITQATSATGASIGIVTAQLSGMASGALKSNDALSRAYDILAHLGDPLKARSGERPDEYLQRLGQILQLRAAVNAPSPTDKFGDTLDASTRATQVAMAHQQELYAAQRQGAQAVDALTVKLAGQTAALNALNQAGQQNAVITMTQIANASALAAEAQQMVLAVRDADFRKGMAAEAAALQAGTDDMKWMIAARKEGAAAVDNMTVAIAGETAVRQLLNDATAKGITLHLQEILAAQHDAEVHARAAVILQHGTDVADTYAKTAGAVAVALHGIADASSALGAGAFGKILNSGANIAQALGQIHSATNQKDGTTDIVGLVSGISGVFGSAVGILSAAFSSNHAALNAQTAVIKQNIEAEKALDLRIAGFVAASADNSIAAYNALKAYDKNSAAQAAIQSYSSTGVGGVGLNSGSIDKQIAALQPFLKDAGLTFTEFEAIAKNAGHDLEDGFGRIVPSALKQFEDSVLQAAQAAFTLSKSYDDQIAVANLLAQAQGKTTTLDQLTTARNAIAATDKGIGVPGGDLSTASAQNALRQWVISQLQKEQSPDGLDATKLGGFQSIQDFNAALSALISPLNSLSDAVNSTTNVLNAPTGFKVAAYEFIASLPTPQTGIDQYGIPRPNPLPTPTTTPTLGNGSTQIGEAKTPTPIMFTGDVKFVLASDNAADLMKEIGTQAQLTAKRAGTTPLTVATTAAI